MSTVIVVCDVMEIGDGLGNTTEENSNVFFLCDPFMLVTL